MPLETGDDAHMLEQLQRGRSLLLAAFAGAIFSLPLILSGKAQTFAMLCWAVSFLGGATAISQIAQPLNIGNITKYLGILTAMFPGWSCAPIGYFLYRTNKALAEEKTVVSRERSRRHVVEKPSTSASIGPSQPSTRPTPTAANSKNQVYQAIAQIKIAGLPNLPDGTKLDVAVSAPGIRLPEDDQPVVLSAKGAFGVIYLVDQGHGFRYVTEGDIRAAGVTPSQLYQIGLNNLTGLISKSKGGLKGQPLGNSYGLVLDGNFEASLVLVDALWDGMLKKYLPNTPVVAIPSRDICAFCDAKSLEGISELKGVSERVSQGGAHLISPLLFTREDGKWTEFKGIQ